MSLQAYPARATQPEQWEHVIRILGATGAASIVAPTGRGITLAYGASGLLTLTWKENPGTYLGADACFQATTMSDLKGYTAVFGVYNATNFTLAVTVYNSSFTAIDLAALQWVALFVKFAEVSSTV